MQERLLLFLITIILYIVFIFSAKKNKLPKILTPSPDMGIWSKIGYSLFSILVCYIILRISIQ